MQSEIGFQISGSLRRRDIELERKITTLDPAETMQLLTDKRHPLILEPRHDNSLAF